MFSCLLDILVPVLEKLYEVTLVTLPDKKWHWRDQWRAGINDQTLLGPEQKFGESCCRSFERSLFHSDS